MKIAGLKEFVYHEMKKKLMSGKIKQGQRIWENEIAEEFGVSRTPVREAINRLIAEGFIENRPRKGIFATEVSKEELTRMLDIRVVLEQLSVKICCLVITESEIEELNNIYNDFSMKLMNKEYGEASELDSKLHKYIVHVANNKKLKEYIDDIQDLFAYSRTEVAKWTDKKIERSLKDHKNLVEAISMKNEEQALELILKDIESMRQLLIS